MKHADNHAEAAPFPWPRILAATALIAAIVLFAASMPGFEG